MLTMLQSLSKLKHAPEFPGCIHPYLVEGHNFQVSEADWTQMDTKISFLRILSLIDFKERLK